MVADEIRALISEVEELPDSRLKTLRLTSLNVLLNRTIPEVEG